jgi:hypothetical protein
VHRANLRVCSTVFQEFVCVLISSDHRSYSVNWYQSQSSIWWRDGWKWVVVCDAVVITTGTPWAFTVEEGSGQLIIEQVVEKIVLVGSQRSITINGLR